MALAASHDPREYTSAARAAFLGKFEIEVDPGATLPVEERLRRAEAARRLHFTRLAMKSARARGARKSKAAASAQVARAAGEEADGGSRPDLR